MQCLIGGTIYPTIIKRPSKAIYNPLNGLFTVWRRGFMNYRPHQLYKARQIEW